MRERELERLVALASEFSCCVSITLVLRDCGTVALRRQRSASPAAMGVCAVGWRMARRVYVARNASC